jgi:intraflagellar transport protein 80
MMDNFSGIQVYTYNGLLKCNPKFSGLRTEFLNHQSVSLSNDTLAIIDLGKRKSGETQGVIRLFDVNTGKQLNQTIKHSMEIVEVALNQTGPSLDRKLVFIDRNRDLYICTLRGHEKYKLATMVDSIKWNDSTQMLVAIADSKFIVWYYPSIVYIDRDLLPAIKHTREDRYCTKVLVSHHYSDFGKRSHIINFYGNRCEVRRWNGVVVTCQVSPYPIMLSEMEEKKNWGGAIRLCRFVKDNTLWACLAAMAIKDGQLNVAEVALAAIEEVSKTEDSNPLKGG